MKVLIVVAAALLLTGITTPGQAGCGKGMPGDCGNCMKSASKDPADPWRKFQAETIDLRQEMMTKRFELQRENLKPLPDRTKEAALQKEIDDLRAKIRDIHAKSGLPNDKWDGECGSCNQDCAQRGMGTKGCNGKHRKNR